MAYPLIGCHVVYGECVCVIVQSHCVCVCVCVCDLIDDGTVSVQEAYYGTDDDSDVRKTKEPPCKLAHCMIVSNERHLFILLVKRS